MDWDPNAVTDQVEAPGFVLGTPTYEAEAPRPPDIEASAAEAPRGEAATSDRPPPEPPTVGPVAIGIDAVEPTATDTPALLEPARAETALPTFTAAEPATPAWVSAEVADPTSARAGRTPEPPTESAPTDTPQIDNTQTIRALTPLELADGQSSRWFAIQLLLCEEEIDPHEVPNLSIFSEYRLYAVTGLDQDRCMHALRLGFFSSENAAAAVAGYLGTFFEAPCIKRVSTAEHDRFEEGRVTARKDVGAGDGHAVIELAGPAPASAPRASEKLPDQAKHNMPKATSIWSRLLPMRKT